MSFIRKSGESPTVKALRDRLVNVGGDLHELHDDFYDFIIKNSGQPTTPAEAVMVLAAAYKQYLPKSSVEDIYGRRDAFLEAILQDAEKVEQAKKLWYGQ